MDGQRVCKKFRVEPNYSTKSLRQDVTKDHILQVSSLKYSRTNKPALKMIQEVKMNNIIEFMIILLN
ncbi:hypothetical protein GQ457_09G008310 [Hibiscus cannabinus]